MQFNLERLDSVESKRVRAIVHPAPKECFTNALHSMLYVPGGVYVEGWAALRLGPILTAHGWIEVGGRIIECTTESYIGYYPVRRWSKPWPVAGRQKFVPLLPFDIPRGKTGVKIMREYHRAMQNEYGIDLKDVRRQLAGLGKATS